MFSSDKHVVNSDVKDQFCLCDIAECLFQNNPSKEKLLCRFYLHMCHSYSVFHLSCLCPHDWESFSVVLRCEKFLLSDLFGLNKNVPVCVAVSSQVTSMFCLARLGPQLVLGDLLNFLFGQSDHKQANKLRKLLYANLNMLIVCLYLRYSTNCITSPDHKLRG